MTTILYAFSLFTFTAHADTVQIIPGQTVQVGASTVTCNPQALPGECNVYGYSDNGSCSAYGCP